MRNNIDKKILNSQYMRLLAANIIIFSAVAINFAGASYITAIFLEVFPSDWLAYLYTSQGLCLIFVVLVIGPIASRNPRSFNITFQVMAITILLSAAYFLSSHVRSLTFVYCILIFVIMQLNTTNSWNYAAVMLNMREFKRYNYILNSVGSIGGIIFGLLQPLLIREWGLTVLLYTACIILFFAGIIYVIQKPQQQIIRKEKRPKPAGNYKVLQKLFIGVILIQIVFFLCDFIFKSALTEAFTKEKIAMMMSVFLAISQLFCVIIQFFGQRLIQQKFGILGLFLVMPLVIIPLGFIFSLAPSIIAAVILNLFSAICYFSFFTAAREQTLNIMPNPVRIRGKFLLKCFAAPVGAIIASGLIFLFGNYLNIELLGVVVTITGIIAIWVVWQIAKFYQITLKDALVLRRFDSSDELADKFDSNFYQAIVNSALEDKNTSVRLLGLKLLPRANFTTIPKPLYKFIRTDDKELKIATIKSFRNFDNPKIVDLIKNNLEIENDARIYCHLLIALEELNVETTVRLSLRQITNENPMIRAISASIILQHGRLEHIASAIHVLQDMLKSSRPDIRASAAKTLSRVNIGNLDQELQSLITDENSNVSRNAIKSAVMLDNTTVIFAISQQLTRDNVFYTSMRALLIYGDRGIPFLKRNLTSHDQKLVVNTLKVLTRISGEIAERAIIDYHETFNTAVMTSLAKYSAYRAKHQGIGHDYKKFVKYLIEREVATTLSLEHMFESSNNKFQRQEIKSRIYSAQLRFLYWLAVINDPTDILNVLPVIMQNVSKPSNPSYSTALELLETLIHERYYINYMTRLFDLKSADGKLNLVSQVSPYSDPWLDKVLACNISEKLRSEGMDQLQKVMVLRSSELFNKLSSEAILAVADSCDVREFFINEIIYEENEPANTIFIIASGDIALMNKDNSLLKLTEGQAMGLMTILNESTYPTSAKALSDGILLTLDKETFDIMTDDMPEVLKAVMQTALRYFYGLQSS